MSASKHRIYHKMQLAAHRLQKAADHDHVTATHQEFASELGSAREVISRQLQEFQRHGWIKASRGEIRIVDRKALARLVQG